MQHRCEFSCESCIFVQMIGNTQIGCQMDRLEKLLDGPLSENLKESDDGRMLASYGKFCNMGRTQDWADRNSGNDLKVKIAEEIFPPIGYIIDFKEDMATLETTLNSLVKPRYVIVINEKVEYNQEIYNKLESLYENEAEYRVIHMLRELPFHMKLDEVFDHCKSGWVTLIKAGCVLPHDFTDRIYNRINHEVKRFGLCVNEDETKMIVQSQIFKFLGGNKPKLQDDHTVDRRNFFDRVSDYVNSDADISITWEEMFNES